MKISIPQKGTTHESSVKKKLNLSVGAFESASVSFMIAIKKYAAITPDK
jgi:hypothetical protein